MAVMTSRPLSRPSSSAMASAAGIASEPMWRMDSLCMSSSSKACPRRAVHERGQRRGRPRAHADQSGRGTRALAEGKLRHLARPGQRRAEQAAAEAVEHAELDALDHVARNVVEAQRGGERRQIARGVLVQRRLGGAHARLVFCSSDRIVTCGYGPPRLPRMYCTPDGSCNGCTLRHFDSRFRDQRRRAGSNSLMPAPEGSVSRPDGVLTGGSHGRARNRDATSQQVRSRRMQVHRQGGRAVLQRALREGERLRRRRNCSRTRQRRRQVSVRPPRVQVTD